MGPLMADVITLRAGGTDYRVEVRKDGIAVDDVAVSLPRHAWAVAVNDVRWVFLDGEVYEFEVQRQGRRKATAHQGSLSAPMPATVIRINVAPGDTVKKGDTLLVLEAMKMELPVRAPADGVVETISCRAGELVQAGVTLIHFAS
jgi:biotin carboxyl carrier protein